MHLVKKENERKESEQDRWEEGESGEIKNIRNCLAGNLKHKFRNKGFNENVVVFHVFKYMLGSKFRN